MTRAIPASVFEHFRRIPLFADLSKAGLTSLVRAATEVEVAEGKDVVQERETDRFLYVIVSGSATVTQAGRTIRSLGPGDFFGELAFLSGGPRSATVTVTSDATLMILSPRELDAVIHAEPKMALVMLTTLAGRLRSAEASATS